MHGPSATLASVRVTTGYILPAAAVGIAAGADVTGGDAAGGDAAGGDAAGGEAAGGDATGGGEGARAAVVVVVSWRAAGGGVLWAGTGVGSASGWTQMVVVMTTVSIISDVTVFHTMSRFSRSRGAGAASAPAKNGAMAATVVNFMVKRR